MTSMIQVCSKLAPPVNVGDARSLRDLVGTHVLDPLLNRVRTYTMGKRNQDQIRSFVVLDIWIRRC